MVKDKKNQQEPNEDQNNPSPNGADEGQTMVALTYDEYEALQNELESLEAQAEGHKDSWMRTAAEFENYKKRVQRDASRSYQDAMVHILKIFLEVADDMERAIVNQPQGKGKDVDSWLNGIELIYQKLINKMKNQGVERMDVKPGDEFDPNIHEAITQEEHPEFQEGQIIDVVQPGYQVADRIIRPAMVRVAQ